MFVTLNDADEVRSYPMTRASWEAARAQAQRLVDADEANEPVDLAVSAPHQGTVGIPARALLAATEHNGRVNLAGV